MFKLPAHIVKTLTFHDPHDTSALSFKLSETANLIVEVGDMENSGLYIDPENPEMEVEVIDSTTFRVNGIQLEGWVQINLRVDDVQITNVQFEERGQDHILRLHGDNGELFEAELREPLASDDLIVGCWIDWEFEGEAAMVGVETLGAQGREIIGGCGAWIKGKKNPW